MCDNVSLSIMVNLASDLFQELKNIQSVTEKYDYVMKKDPKFMSHYPIVFKYMIIDKYCPEAFHYMLRYKQELLIDNVQNNANDKKTNIKNYYMHQAEYARQLFINCNYTRDKLQEIYNTNYNEVQKMYSESENLVAVTNEKIEKDRRSNLVDFIKREMFTKI